MSQPDNSQKRPTYRAYLFGKGYYTGTDGKPIFSYPYTVHYTPDHPVGAFFLAEGDARVGNGAYFPEDDLLKPIWREHLEITGTLWLLPLLERHTHGDTVSPAQFLGAYEKAKGIPPPVEEWRD